MLDLESIFGDGPATPASGPGGSDVAAAPVAPAGAPEADTLALGPSETSGNRGDGLQPEGESSGNVPAADALGDLHPRPDFSGWKLRPDFGGRLGLEAPDLPEADRWWAGAGFDDLPEPGDPCAECGSVEPWLDLAGGRHCTGCERAGLERALRLAGRAARLRLT